MNSADDMRLLRIQKLIGLPVQLNSPMRAGVLISFDSAGGFYQQRCNQGARLVGIIELPATAGFKVCDVADFI